MSPVALCACWCGTRTPPCGWPPPQPPRGTGTARARRHMRGAEWEPVPEVLTKRNARKPSAGTIEPLHPREELSGISGLQAEGFTQFHRHPCVKEIIPDMIMASGAPETSSARWRQGDRAKPGGGGGTIPPSTRSWRRARRSQRGPPTRPFGSPRRRQARRGRRSR